MRYMIDCGFESVSATQLRAALKNIGFTGIRIKNLGKNDYEIEILEVVKPAEMALSLDRNLGRTKAEGSITQHVDAVKVEILEGE